MDDAKVKEMLRAQNEEFRRIEEKHHKYEAELNEISDLAFLTPEQNRKKKELKKRKLQLKDQMYQIMRAYEKGA